MSDRVKRIGFPKKQGLYDPANEKDSCGVGFVANVKGVPSHQIVLDAIQMLKNMDHRGACGCEANTGDGSGILTGLPWGFLEKVAREEMGVELPAKGRFGAGLVFLPQIEAERTKCIATVESIIAEQGQTCLGWRAVPVQADKADVGPSARAAEPCIMQLFIGAAEGVEGDDFERQLYIIRKRASHQLRLDASLEQALLFYICSLSTKVMIYKGMLTTDQLLNYFDDLSNPDFQTHLAMVHSRFSTNTFPSWDRAQPFRFMSHNGEINTMRGNINWMRAREGTLRSELLSDDLQKLYPIMEPECSDSGNFDNALEFLLMSGRSLQESVLLMVPEAWQKHRQMPQAKRDFYEYNSCLMEPWDGPASIAFTDGKYIGAVLDRNGLRPSRYYLTHDDRVIMASEVGVIPVDPHVAPEFHALSTPADLFPPSSSEPLDFISGGVDLELGLAHPVPGANQDNDRILFITRGDLGAVDASAHTGPLTGHVHSYAKVELPVQITGGAFYNPDTFKISHQFRTLSP